ncbi:hypothetical protein LTR37_005659 [Vermiconidia calcicola]|uniref:Uncharacterized protein n=1 Tax=Vermiconidia calcicola TaxID=1690605 RepID=A0ACC3NIP5_9PEZI|nr:hypothetical protein LTR37_005659 [Vermiconidia calcicola]
MPTYKDVSVQVTDANNEPLKEWGAQKRDRTKLSTCYIKSETNMAFRILIKPSQTLIRDYEDEPVSLYGHHEEELDMIDDDFEDVISPRSPRSPPPPAPKPWHLLATLRLDARRTYEKRSILYLDRTNPSFGLVNDKGDIMMRCRTYVDATGHARECGWLFKEVGIETAFDTLLLSGGDKEVVPAPEEDELVAALGGMAANGMEDCEENSTVGQIEVTLDRIVLGETTEGWMPRNDEDHDMGVKASDLSKVSHTATRDYGKTKVGPSNTIFYDYMDSRKEKPYATFKFYYRSENILRRLFGGGEITPRSTTRSMTRARQDALNRVAASPLSILNPKAPKNVYNTKGQIIAVEDLSPHTPTKKFSPGALTDGKTWVPKNHTLPSIMVDDLSSADRNSSLKDSPVQDDSEATTKFCSTPKTSLPGLGLQSPLGEAEQSSADESSPLKPMSTLKPESQLKNHIQFRMIGEEAAEEEDADDEASDGTRTPNSMGFTADNGNAVGDDDNGVSQNMPDQGLGAKLGELDIRKRGGGEDENEESNGEAKKKIRVGEMANTFAKSDHEHNADEERYGAPIEGNKAEDAGQIAHQGAQSSGATEFNNAGSQAHHEAQVKEQVLVQQQETELLQEEELTANELAH